MLRSFTRRAYFAESPPDVRLFRHRQRIPVRHEQNGSLGHSARHITPRRNVEMTPRLRLAAGSTDSPSARVGGRILEADTARAPVRLGSRLDHATFGPEPIDLEDEGWTLSCRSQSGSPPA